MGLEQRLSALRKDKKMSQQELAEMAGIHPNVLGRYERGEASPSIDMASKLANALEVSLDYLVGNTDLELDKALIDKVVSIQKLPEEDKTCIMYSLDGLIQHAKTRLAYK
jgi:transcriptional regulator with XRE-family HTH domain